MAKILTTSLLTTSLLSLTMNADQISDFKTCFGLVKQANGKKNAMVIREFKRKGVNLEAEILLTEQKMIESGLTPSVFFRFPGLVSNARSFTRITALGLIPVGSDAWLAKKQSPRGGSIVLIHGNGNEPLGIIKFLALLKKEMAAIKKKNWLLFDLRTTIAQQERQQPRH